MMKGGSGMRPELTGLGARVRAFSVHVFTALGAALALLALIAAGGGQWALMFLWLGIALIVDGVDGALARYVRVAELVPRWSGDVLDVVVDFANYVLVPAYAILTAGLLPSGAGTALSVVIVVTGALYCADIRMKSSDHYFWGFPALWNAVAFYLFVLELDPWINAIVVLALAVLTFVPFPFLHPIRVARLRTLNIALLAVWSLLALVTVLSDLHPGGWVTSGLCVIALYFIAAGLLRRFVW